MSDDLVKRLRDLGDRAEYMPHMHHVAADRIEELEERLKAATDDAKEAEAYAGELEVKLAKAMEPLEAFKAFDDLPTAAKRPDVFEIKVRKPILLAIAELTGGKDE